MTDKKMIDTLEMTHEDNTPKEAIATTATDIKKEDEVLLFEGKTVATRNSKGEIIVFDADGLQIPSDTLQTLYEKYKVAPEYDNQDTPKKGKIKVRYTKEQNYTKPDENNPNKILRGRETVECKPEEAELVSESQWYESGQLWSKTIEARFYPVIKFLRGEIDFPEKKKEG
jgi:hypothetical protein